MVKLENLLAERILLKILVVVEVFIRDKLRLIYSPMIISLTLYHILHK